ncbi:glycerate kinase type-2 family protein [Rhodospirillaceae bacterium SYSU D60014]|uniref:glycerate kinase type-2 family protein n=1 Tax=Virgifigura deserti TaxID=2268457 RepID=UPI000E66D90D
MSIAPRTLLCNLFDAALAAADPARCVPPHLPPRPKGRTVVIGAGKAAASMARAVEENWDGPLSGLIVTRYGHGLPCTRIEVVEAAHPVPDIAGHQAAARILAMVQGLSADDLVLALISGGGSALLSQPAPGLTLEDKQRINAALLRSGANIAEMNCVRKHLSAIKGGRLAAAAAPARLVSLLISDVPGDDPAVIASGPTVADPTTFADALAILEKYRITEPEAAVAHLRAARDETPKPGDPRLAASETVIVTRPQASLEAAAAAARQAGLTPVILGDGIEGEARDVALVHAGIARQVARHGQPVPAPAVLLSGGETTVTVRGEGRGGRNAEFLLALAVALDGHPGIHAIAGDTDGIDGTEDNAGCLLAPDSLARAQALGFSGKARLADNDGYGFFAALDDLVITGPTRTNVNDFRAILVQPGPAGG